ncbi:MAG: alpha-amylase family glycosyl hydrolase [bacterium]
MGDTHRGPRIYNLFPTLAGRCKEWNPHIERASAMGFNWVFINPFHTVGSSKSLYAIKDYYSYNPLLFSAKNTAGQEKELRETINNAGKSGVNLIADLVINHTSIQSPLIKKHPQWYKRDEDGKLVNPGAMDNGKMHYWRDLATVDNSGSKDKIALWGYWRDLLRHYLSLGFRGFRCDAAYQVSSDLWAYLIEETKKVDPSVKFFAETLGCSIEQTLDVAASGFDYIYNSGKWWDFQQNWFLEQHQKTQPKVGSITFPESHDTGRLAKETNNDINVAKMRYAFSALATTGVMIPIGFEYGFRKGLNVKKTSSTDWEKGAYDLCDYIKKVNQIKEDYEIFNQETRLERIDVDNPSVLVLCKHSSRNSSKAYLIINKDKKKEHTVMWDQNGQGKLEQDTFQDLLPEESPRSLRCTCSSDHLIINKSQVKIFYQG